MKAEMWWINQKPKPRIQGAENKVIGSRNKPKTPHVIGAVIALLVLAGLIITFKSLGGIYGTGVRVVQYVDGADKAVGR